MGKDSKFQKEKKAMLLEKYRKIISDLPEFVKLYMSSIETDRQPNTLVAYAYDYKTFFRFLHTQNPLLSKKPIKDITLDDLALLTLDDFNEYKKYLHFSTTSEKKVIHNNEKKSIARKVTSLKRLFNYYHVLGQLEHDYMQLVAHPRVEKDKDSIVELDGSEVGKLLQCVKHGIGLSNKQLETYEDTKYRDIAIIYVFLETGMRLSELCGIDLDDLDFEKRIIRIVRKGGGSDKVFFGNKVSDALEDYLVHVRNNASPQTGHEEALFLSKQHKRICIRAVENIVEKYTKAALGKAYSPHKLRSTYGSRLYAMTGDVKLVADNLGNSPNVASKYYAKQVEERQRAIAEQFDYN